MNLRRRRSQHRVGQTCALVQLGWAGPTPAVLQPARIWQELVMSVFGDLQRYPSHATQTIRLRIWDDPFCSVTRPQPSRVIWTRLRTRTEFMTGKMVAVVSVFRVRDKQRQKKHNRYPPQIHWIPNDSHQKLPTSLNTSKLIQNTAFQSAGCWSLYFNGWSDKDHRGQLIYQQRPSLRCASTVMLE